MNQYHLTRRTPQRGRRARRGFNDHGQMIGSENVTRRELLRVLGSSAATGMVGIVSPWKSVLHAERLGQSTPFPSGAIIRTVLKDFEPNALGEGAVLFHEHLSARWGRSTHYSDDVALMAEEVKASGKDGVACIVDAGSSGYRPQHRRVAADCHRFRNPNRLRAAAIHTAAVSAGDREQECGYPGR